MSKIEESYKAEDMVGFYQKQKQDAEARLEDFYTPMIDQDEKQAQDYQQSLEKFEKDFFAKYVAQAAGVSTIY